MNPHLPKRYLVMTLVIGQQAEELYSFSKKSIEEYAERIGADFACIAENLFPNTDIPVYYSKLRIREFLDNYDRVLLLDCDVIVSRDTPNIFDIVPEDAIGVLKESDFFDRTSSIKEVEEALGKIKGWEFDYFNVGVLVVSKIHQHLFENPEKFILGDFPEQTYLNWKVRALDYKIYYLDHKFNYIFYPGLSPASLSSAYIAHFAGWGFQVPRSQQDDKHTYKYHQMKCFRDYLEGRNTFRIHPEQLLLNLGKINKEATLCKFVSHAGDRGLVSYGPYIQVTAGSYKITIDFEFNDKSLKNTTGFIFDIASNNGNHIWYKSKIDTSQEQVNFIVNLRKVKDLEVRFYATGIPFYINFVEFYLLDRDENVVELTKESEFEMQYNEIENSQPSVTNHQSLFDNPPRILFESFPLTLKQGTGISTYSINVLETFNNLGILDIGLLFIFDNQIKKLGFIKNKKILTRVRYYAQLLEELARSRSAINDRATSDSVSTPISKARVVRGYIHALNDYLSILFSLFKKLDAIDLPSYMKPSLMEVILEGDSPVYDFLAKNIPYIVDLKRHSLLVRNMVGIGNTIALKDLKDKYDVFHCAHLSAIAVPGLPRVTTIHDIIPLVRPELTKDNRSLFGKLLELNIKESNRIIAVSETTKRDLVNSCNVPAEKITVIYEAASRHLSPVSYSEAAPILRSLGLFDFSGNLEPYFLFIGNIEPKKNIKRLLEAFKQFFLADKVGYKLVIVGAKAWGYDSVKKMLEEMVESQTVISTGYLPANYLPALLSHARAFVFPSLIEGFGLPVLEAMACGCPVITSNVSSIAEVCGDAAIQVNPQSVYEICKAIARVASDDALCQSLREKGFERNKLFSWEKCARLTLEVYEEARQNYLLKK